MENINIILKRIIDLFLSIIAIVICLPIWLVVPLIIRLDSEGPILFKQPRRTKDGMLFDMYKFRTMVVNAEKMGTGLFNFEDDPRVTKVGKILRQTSLDELPQLFNVLIGDMSIVGPRPCVSYELGDFETLNKRYRERFNVKAGITGLAQVKGRNDISWDEKVSYDNQYVANFKTRGVLEDILIIFSTIISVFKKENIYEVRDKTTESDVEAAKRAEEEVIRLAHLPD